jgi:hypothetical protein
MRALTEKHVQHRSINAVAEDWNKQEMTHAVEIHRIPNGRRNFLPASRSRPVRDLELLGARSAHGTEGPEIGTKATLVPQSAIIALLEPFRSGLRRSVR